MSSVNVVDVWNLCIRNIHNKPTTTPQPKSSGDEQGCVSQKHCEKIVENIGGKCSSVLWTSCWATNFRQRATNL